MHKLVALFAVIKSAKYSNSAKFKLAASPTAGTSSDAVSSAAKKAPKKMTYPEVKSASFKWDCQKASWITGGYECFLRNDSDDAQTLKANVFPNIITSTDKGSFDAYLVCYRSFMSVQPSSGVQGQSKYFFRIPDCKNQNCLEEKLSEISTEEQKNIAYRCGPHWECQANMNAYNNNDKNAVCSCNLRSQTASVPAMAAVISVTEETKLPNIKFISNGEHLHSPDATNLLTRSYRNKNNQLKEDCQTNKETFDRLLLHGLSKFKTEQAQVAREKKAMQQHNEKQPVHQEHAPQTKKNEWRCSPSSSSHELASCSLNDERGEAFLTARIIPSRLDLKYSVFWRCSGSGKAVVLNGKRAFSLGHCNNLSECTSSLNTVTENHKKEISAVCSALAELPFHGSQDIDHENLWTCRKTQTDKCFCDAQCRESKFVLQLSQKRDIQPESVKSFSAILTVDGKIVKNDFADKNPRLTFETIAEMCSSRIPKKLEKWLNCSAPSMPI